ncbi:unnamed protein product [Paramecium octaurelia]|uniref:Uncharacterized protein n=1 Tax=Paramecium octaurelia TaxID=43137 RepID=A0A8S1WMK1_PAROT|nr:unnamed protein product [Paramecium octaurelia]
MIQILLWTLLHLEDLPSLVLQDKIDLKQSANIARNNRIRNSFNGMKLSVKSSNRVHSINLLMLEPNLLMLEPSSYEDLVKVFKETQKDQEMLSPMKFTKWRGFSTTNPIQQRQMFTKNNLIDYTKKIIIDKVQNNRKVSLTLSNIILQINAIQLHLLRCVVYVRRNILIMRRS